MADPDLDVSPVNSDAARSGAWDLWLPDASGLVQTLEQLRTALQMNDRSNTEWAEALRGFQGLPSWIPAPEPLKKEADQYLGRNTG